MTSQEGSGSIHRSVRDTPFAPLRAGSWGALGQSLYFTRRYDQAIEQMHQTIDMDASDWFAFVVRGAAYRETARLSEALADLKKAKVLGEPIPWPLGELGRAYALSGSQAQAQEIRDALKDQWKGNPVGAYNIVTVYAVLGEKDQAFAWLEKAYEDRSFFLTGLKIDLAMDTLRSDPRFKDLLRRMNFPP